MDSYLHKLESKDLLELARNLIVLEIPLPLKLEQALIKHKHV